MRSLLSLSLAVTGAAAAGSVYAPNYTTCPTEALVRSADGISSDEATYLASRKSEADKALTSWLSKALPGVNSSSLPTVALATSGGGFRSMLVGAGVVQALDKRDSNASTAGLYQALSYHAGLSGGAWLVSALAASNWPTVSFLKNTVWEQQLAGGILDPTNAMTVEDYTEIAEDIIAKALAGFPVTLVDAWGRIVGYQIMAPVNGTGAEGVSMAGLVAQSNFTAHRAPFPIITASNIDYEGGECVPTQDEAIFEFNPFEFGSWSDDVSAFVKTRYLGSSLTAGVASKCVEGYDRIDWALGTSSDILEEYICDASLGVDIVSSFPAELVEVIEEFTTVTDYGYSVVPNPFRGFNSTTASAPSVVSGLDELHMVDGGEPDRNIPILPLLEPSRNVSVLLASDNSNDNNGFPEGAALVAAWNATQTGRLAGRFPRVPAEGNFSTKQAQFFGCDEPEAVTVVYLPNSDWTYASNTSTLQLAYPEAETAAMIADGNAVATQGGDKQWAKCLACGLMLKEVGAKNLPCDACLSKYCWSG